MTVAAGARMIDNAELLRERLRAAPTGAGVYLMCGGDGRVIYVGKAANVRNRLRSYFAGVGSHPGRTRQLVERIVDFEVIACLNEREALILENTLIKRYHPRFNIRLKDDKNYLYLKIPRPGDADAAAPGTAREELRAGRGRSEGDQSGRFPRPYYTRRLVRDGARYFGPYTSAQSLRTTVRSLRGLFPFRTCSDEIFRRGKVCLDYHIKRCAGPCEARIEADEYARLLDQVELFMQGHTATLVGELRGQMDAAAERMNYEAAARHRDRLKAIERMSERQTMLSGVRRDQDFVAVALGGSRGMAAILSVRYGRVVGMETHEIEGVAEASPAECLASFVQQYYGSATAVPRTVLLSEVVSDQAALIDFLAGQRGGPVELRVPVRGELRQLLSQARDTAISALAQKKIVDDFDADRTDALLADLADRLNLPLAPQRIECYDISNTMGTNSVGSMVVFEAGRPRPAHYRHFTIKTVEGPDDFASMAETLRRRFGRYRTIHGDADNDGDVPVSDPAGSNGEGDSDGGDGGLRVADESTPAPPQRRRATAADDSFEVLPDLILIDGGKGQLSAARTVLEELGLADVAVFGLAKQNEELFRPDAVDPIVIERDSPTLFLVQRVRDEAHRFAITRHRARRSKAALRSRLDDIPGLGPARKRALLQRFGTVDAIRQADVDDVAAVPGVPRSLALRLRELL